MNINNNHFDHDLFKAALNGFDQGFKVGFIACMAIMAAVSVLYLSFNA